MIIHSRGAILIKKEHKKLWKKAINDLKWSNQWENILTVIIYVRE